MTPENLCTAYNGGKIFAALYHPPPPPPPPPPPEEPPPPLPELEPGAVDADAAADAIEAPSPLANAATPRPPRELPEYQPGE